MTSYVGENMVLIHYTMFVFLATLMNLLMSTGVPLDNMQDEQMFINGKKGDSCAIKGDGYVWKQDHKIRV